MNHRERMALDEHIAGGHYSKCEVELVCVEPVREGTCNNGEDCAHEVACGTGCGWSGIGVTWSEYGASGTEPEECPDCGGRVDVEVA